MLESLEHIEQFPPMDLKYLRMKLEYQQEFKEHKTQILHLLYDVLLPLVISVLLKNKVVFLISYFIN